MYIVDPKISNIYVLMCNRYALNLVVLDSTGDTNFLLFENVAEQLIGQPCSALIGGNIDEVYELIYYYVFYNL